MAVYEKFTAVKSLRMVKVDSVQCENAIFHFPASSSPHSEHTPARFACTVHCSQHCHRHSNSGSCAADDFTIHVEQSLRVASREWPRLFCRTTKNHHCFMLCCRCCLEQLNLYRINLVSMLSHTHTHNADRRKSVRSTCLAIVCHRKYSKRRRTHDETLTQMHPHSPRTPQCETSGRRSRHIHHGNPFVNYEHNFCVK